MRYYGALRAVRGELAPNIPNLAQELPTDQFAIRGAMLTALIDKGVDIDEIPEVDLLKTEQHIMIAWGGGIMRHDMVDGDGREAVFKPRLVHCRPQRERVDHFSQLYLSVHRAMYDSAINFANSYTYGDNPEALRIMPVLRHRYADIGIRRSDLLLEEEATTIGYERVDFLAALQSATLARVTSEHLTFIDRVVQGGPPEKLTAAHDTSYVPYSLAAHNGGGFEPATTALRSALVGATVMRHAETERYILKTVDGQPFHIPRSEPDSPEVTLKCPLRADGNLLAFIGAGINVSGQFGVFA